MSKIRRRIAWALGLVAALLAVGVYRYTHRPLYRIPSDPTQADSIRFFALGDQGSGGFRQWQVAHGMERLAERQGQLDFVLLLGDNLYRAADASADSQEWLSKFERVYAGTYLSVVPFYAVLGNHDHGEVEEKGGGAADAAGSPPRRPLAQAEIEYARRHLGSNRWRMPDQWYSADFGKAGARPLLRIVFIDTSLKPELLARQAEFIRQAFREGADAPVWRIVVGHHPVNTYGAHRGKVAGVAAALLPALRDAGVDIYLSGHDHNQQVIVRDGEPFQFIDGGGGAALYPIREHPADLIFARSGYGFVSARVEAGFMEIGHADEKGGRVSSFRIERNCPRGQASCLVAVP